MMFRMLERYPSGQVQPSRTDPPGDRQHKRGCATSDNGGSWIPRGSGHDGWVGPYPSRGLRSSTASAGRPQYRARSRAPRTPAPAAGSQESVASTFEAKSSKNLAQSSTRPGESAHGSSPLGGRGLRRTRATRRRRAGPLSSPRPWCADATRSRCSARWGTPASA